MLTLHVSQHHLLLAPSLAPLQSQCWFNEARTRKPQTFTSAASEAAAFDATNSGESCDFCRCAARCRVLLMHAVPLACATAAQCRLLQLLQTACCCLRRGDLCCCVPPLQVAGAHG